ncbi:MAG: helix-turn-helix domain-containing protein [Hespellia sp.]|nr:helix-turn-helix domain-containing protein [Hespellia sp.]
MDFDFVTKKMQDTHFHQNLEIVYVLDGEMEIQIETESYHMEKGDYLLINANKRHSYKKTSGELLVASFWINYSMLSEYLETNQLLFWCNTVADKSDEYEQLKKVLDQILNHFYDKEKEGALYLSSIYYEALYLLSSYFMIKSDDSRLKSLGQRENSRVFEIQNYVQSNYTKQISLNDLAKKLYLSNAYLSKYIKKNFGLSFLEYVNNIRLFHAVDELLYSEKRITRIALDNGFATTASFNKAFKDSYNMTPSVYRTTVRQESKAVESGDESKQQISQRVKEYLSGVTATPDEGSTKNLDEVTIDARKTTPLSRTWDEIINIGKIDELLDRTMQEHILILKQEIGFRYVRVWNIFIKEMYEEIDGAWHYNFSRVDRGLDFLVKNGFKPYIELSFKPLDVSFSLNSTLSERENDIIFHDRNSYQKIMNDFAAHLTNRYGIDEIESWYFELWKDDRMNMQDEKGWYFDCFEIGYQALKRVSEKMKVGGAGFALGYDRYQYNKLIQNWKMQNVRPDFISVYSFSYLLIQQDGVYFGKRSLDNGFVKNQLELFRKVLQEEDFMPEELHITEWNFTISSRNCINDSCAQGAYIMKTCIDSVENGVSKMGYWHGSDLHSEYFDSEFVLCGDNGLLSREGVKKPSFYAFHFMHFMKDRLLTKTEHALLTTDGRNNYTIACHNCKQFNYRYMMKEENDVSVEDLEEIYEDLDAIHLRFKIGHVENGEYLMRIYYVNRENGSVQDIWKDMQYLKNLSGGESDYMQRAATPKVELRQIKVEDGVLHVETKLKAHEIRMLDIHYLY